jgi:ABC-type Fe3+/spermidine/putrescine transport system ATPase subunit
LVSTNTDDFERVQKSYDGETLVVKNLNLDIGKGEFLTMLGPSGSGKTTCLMMLAGFETATHGEIRLAASRSTRCRRTSAASAWCSRTMRCSRT